MIMIYLIKTIIFLLFTSFITSSQQLESKLKLYINKVYEINPNSNITNCLSKYHDDSLHLVCKKSHSNQTFNCPNGHPNAKDAWFIRCLAKSLINDGFQVPVYVAAGVIPERLIRLKRHLNNAGFTHVTYNSNFVIGNISQEDINYAVTTTPKLGQNSTLQKTQRCIDILDATIKNIPKARKECEEKGSSFSDKEMSNLLKTVFLQKDVIECEKNSVPLASKCVSNATISSLQYALFLEDDQFIAFDALRLIAELIIQNDKPVGLYYICDSYYNNRKFFPPSHIENTDYINSWVMTESRTTGASLFSLASLRIMFSNGHYLPMVRGIDHQMNYVIQQDKILTHFVFPPITCHGSQGLENDIKANVNLNKYRSCGSKYNVHSMKANLHSMKLIPKNTVI